MSHYFGKDRDADCGENATQSMLSMHSKSTRIRIASKEGTSPKKITTTLRAKGVKAEPKQDITFKALKPKSIAWYPRSDHYVAIEKVKSNKVLVNDSSKKKARWISRKQFEKRWLDKDKKGWVIQT